MTEPDLPEHEPPSEDRNFAVIAHLLGILTMFVGALIIWLIKKDDSPYVDDQAKEAINFQITIFIAEAVAGILVPIGVGCILLPLILVANFILCLVAAMKASQGEWYRYPMTLRLIS
ncbi:MAG: DUF4870 domain-containing protein [Planctomycetota bacterium]|jgi:uncharacterized Tic20 family protein